LQLAQRILGVCQSLLQRHAMEHCALQTRRRLITLGLELHLIFLHVRALTTQPLY
jgi:hypothetical protein